MDGESGRAMVDVDGAAGGSERNARRPAVVAVTSRDESDVKASANMSVADSAFFACRLEEYAALS